MLTVAIYKSNKLFNNGNNEIADKKYIENVIDDSL